MIRVNLLPQAKKKERGAPAPGGQKWLLVVLAVLVVEIVALVFFHQTKVEELDAQNQKNQSLDGEIKKIQQLVANHEDVKKELEVLRAREDAIAELQAGRSGPTAVLLEVGQILTPGKGPTVDAETLKEIQQNNPLMVINQSWDPRRLWITDYVETQREVRIQGRAKDSADVAELGKRFEVSPYFYNVRLLPGKKVKSQNQIEVVDFAIEMNVRY